MNVSHVEGWFNVDLIVFQDIYGSNITFKMALAPTVSLTAFHRVSQSLRLFQLININRMQDSDKQTMVVGFDNQMWFEKPICQV